MIHQTHESLTTNPYLGSIQASAYLTNLGLKTARTTLAKLRVVGGGPKFHKFGRMVLYRPNDLEIWAESRISVAKSSTSA